jgi:CRP/FNR family transcriptional regulator
MIIALAELRQAAITTALRRCHLFADCPIHLLHQIASMTEVRKLARGETLFHEATPVQGFFVVQQGAIKAHRNNSGRREQVIHVFRPGESLAEESLFAEGGHAASACAIEDSQVLLVQRMGFVALLRREPQLALSLLRSLSRQFDLLVGLLDDLTLKDFQTRLGHWLIGHCPDPHSRCPQTIALSESKRLLASELGVSGETFSRALAKFREQRLLAVNGKSLTVLSPFRLAEKLQNGTDQGLPRSTRPRLSCPRPRKTTLLARCGKRPKLAPARKAQAWLAV